MTDIEVYCLKCRAKVKMQEPHPETAKSGAPGIAGTCPECGSRLFRATGRAPKAEVPAKTKAKANSRANGKAKSPARRKGNLVIVESPTKARTIQRYLGRGYTVKASIGHVRDLLRSRLSVDVENNYEPTYRIPND
ncbi:MAG: DUF5679 domain-containing protein, partial [Anaerolineae bacterium]